MQKFTMIFCLLISSLSFYGQGFFKEIDFCNDSGFGKLIFEVGDEYLIFAEDYNHCYTFFKVSSEGKVIRKVEYDFSLKNQGVFSDGRNIAFDEEGNFILTSALVTYEPDRDDDLFFMKISTSTLDTLEARRVRLKKSQDPGGTQFINSNIRVAGSNDSIVDGWLLGSKLFIYDIDLNGNVIDSVIFSTGQPLTDLPEFRVIPNGNTLVGYSTGRGGPFNGVGIASFSPDFDVLWSIEVSELTSERSTPTVDLSLDSSVFYIATSRFDTTRGWRAGYVLAVDVLTGEKVWDQFFHGGNFDIERIIVAEGGGIIGCGRMHAIKKGRIFKLDKNGKKVFDKLYYPQDRERFDPHNDSDYYDIQETSTGDLIVTGSIVPIDWGASGNDVSDVLIMKLDSMGCLTLGCDSISEEVEYPVNVIDNYIQNQVEIYPNPTSDFINLDFNSSLGEVNFSLFSLTGKKVKQINILRSGSQINIADLPKGIYFYKIQNDDNQRIGSGKVVIQ